MMMSCNFFAYISRMRYIERWSLMRNSLPENIQEHSHMVAVIAHALGIIRRDVFGMECDPNECAAVALYHDCSEILTGDLPTPIKYYNPELREAYKQVEKLAGRFGYDLWGRQGAYTQVRFCPSWANTEEQILALLDALS